MRLRLFQLDSVFPAGDPVVNVLFRLATVREDLALELLGASAENLAELDRTDAVLRRIYFVRRSCLSLSIAEELLANVELNKHIAARKASGEAPYIEAAVKHHRLFKKRMKAIRAIRNHSSAHLDGEHADLVLREHGGLLAPIQMSRKVMDVAWRVAPSAIAFGLLGPDVPPSEVTARVRSVVGAIRQATDDGLFAIDYLLFDHMLERNVWR